MLKEEEDKKYCIILSIPFTSKKILIYTALPIMYFFIFNSHESLCDTSTHKSPKAADERANANYGQSILLGQGM